MPAYYDFKCTNCGWIESRYRNSRYCRHCGMPIYKIPTVIREVNLSQEFDAQVWAKEWIKTIKGYPSIPSDEGAMIGWFANAIMAGYDRASSEKLKIQELADDIVAWAKEVFPNQTALAVSKHLQKEAGELADGIDLYGNYEEELADCFMLLLECSQLLGVSVSRLVELTREKLEINKTRKWKEPDENGVIEHIKDINILPLNMPNNIIVMTSDIRNPKKTAILTGLKEENDN